MKKHTKIYLDFFGYGEQDFIPCENCGQRAVDVHHIDPRGMGGDPTGSKDRIDNLVGLCRNCHNKAEKLNEFNEMIKEKHIRRITLWHNTHFIILLVAILTLSSCVSSREVYDTYSKGGHPQGKSKYKGKQYGKIHENYR